MAGGFHTEDIDKLCRTCFGGKKITIKKTINTKLKKIYSININSDNPHIHPINVCHNCYYAMSTAIKREGTISTSPFNNWTQHTGKCEICEREFNHSKKGLLSKECLKLTLLGKADQRFYLESKFF